MSMIKNNRGIDNEKNRQKRNFLSIKFMSFVIFQTNKIKQPI